MKSVIHPRFRPRDFFSFVITFAVIYILFRIGIIGMRAWSLLPQPPSMTHRDAFTRRSEDAFLNLQSAQYSDLYFDMDVLSKQATQEEMDEYLRTGRWPWSDEAKALFQDAVRANTSVRYDPQLALNRAQTIYNETAILHLLKMNSQEGQFLLSGVQVVNSPTPTDNAPFAETSGLASPPYSVIQCDYTNRSKNAQGQLVKDGVPIHPNQLEAEMGGSFTFLNGVCNPCINMDQPPDYSCPFRLNLSTKTTQQPSDISPVWKYLWKV